MPREEPSRRRAFSQGGVRRVLVSALVLLAVLASAQALPKPAPPRDPTYLTILGQPEEFAKEFPAAPPASSRQIGFGIVLYTLNTAPAELRRQTEQALDQAERTGYPVLIHLDDWNFPAASQDPAVAEWSAFPRPGEKRGPVIRRRWINWGSWVVAGAPPNTESPAFRADMRLRVRSVADPVAGRLKRWRAEGKAHLLAGLVVGWESGYYTMDDFRPGERPRAGAEVLGDDEIVRAGYAALTARGQSAATVRKLAARTRRSELEVIHDLMVGVVHDYTAFLCGVCRAAGVPRERIYTHYTGVGALAPDAVPGPLRADGRNMPLRAAVNGASRPGITATLPWTDVPRAAAAFRAERRREWGAVEIEFTDVTRGEEPALKFLEALSGSGARVMCIYGWWEAPEHTFGVRGSGAVPAMKRWLAGGERMPSG